MLENNKTSTGIHYSRYIASWRNVGERYYDGVFEGWLKSEGLTDSEIHDIVEMAITGKFELERSAERFVKKLDK